MAVNGFATAFDWFVFFFFFSGEWDALAFNSRIWSNSRVGNEVIQHLGP